ncbi:Oidioi.mRNA.OKI2018_I69.XSR.g15324.t1.cds [Oikopleura dioica]|uniref:Oidioi.mRNA.OKI2018_I69.XSR.g15324.t1.cds n=1 Tax=Oikopleura dioica TaxID=34765 RepID=A0ABN7SCI1_OIKDI|nr:Oidioi.mRNA.OKI2018_I69.XSR.g15324.t1.cds [Oikopleura dioica]
MGKSVLRTRETDISSKTATVRNRTFSPVRPRSVTMKSDQKLRVVPPVPRPRSTTFSLEEFHRVTAEIRLESEEKREANEHDARRESDSAARMIEKKNRRMKKFEQAFAREFK